MHGENGRRDVGISIYIIEYAIATRSLFSVHNAFFRACVFRLVTMCSVSSRVGKQINDTLVWDKRNSRMPTTA